MFTRCPICQQDVPNWEYQNHVGQHGPQPMARMPVQMMPTAPPAIPNIPGYYPAPAQATGPTRQYYHPQCGGTTAMPPHALQQMAADPFAFGDKVTCTGCGKLVPETEIFWSDSGQSLADYRQEQKNNFVYANKLNPEDFEWDANGPVRRKSKGGAAVALVVGGVAAVVGVLFLGGIFIAVIAAISSNDNSNAAPAPARVTATPNNPVRPAPTAPPPVYTAAPPYTPPVYNPPPTYTPPVYTPPPAYTPPTNRPSGIERADEIMARHRKEAEQRREEMQKRMDDMQRDMDRRMDELRKRTRGLP